jgi:hypothetical protein
MIQSSDHSRSHSERMLRDSVAALRFAHKMIHLNYLHSLFSRRHYDPNQPRVPAGNPDSGQRTRVGGSAGHAPQAAASQPHTLAESDGSSDSIEPTTWPAELEQWMRLAAVRRGPPSIPTRRPPTSGERTSVMREVAKWLRENAGQVIEGVAWLDEFLATIESYLDPPKTLEELQQGVSTPKKGYDIHHIVEQTSAEKDGFPRTVIDAPENLVRIPRMKHWEINAWYGRRNEDFGGVAPRDYLRGKSWSERVRVGRDALIENGVLKP